MSAVFKNSKKKVSQIELRKYMNEHKKNQKILNKIDSPLAKDSGQLTCVLCKSVVRSEAVWNVHINAKQHKENVLAAKKLQEAAKKPSKRPQSPQPETAPKRVKGILKNSGVKGVPDNFFDSDKPKSATDAVTESKETRSKDGKKIEVDESKNVVNEDLPEGFFDDPKLDAKARNLEYKNPIEEEWEKFQKEIKAVDTKSAEIIAEDQEEATTERQIDEIEEQMRNWSRVLTMEKKKDEVKVTIPQETKMEIKEESSDEGEDFDEYLDWRSKKS